MYHGLFHHLIKAEWVGYVWWMLRHNCYVNPALTVLYQDTLGYTESMLEEYLLLIIPDENVGFAALTSRTSLSVTLTLSSPLKEDL